MTTINEIINNEFSSKDSLLHTKLLKTFKTIGTTLYNNESRFLMLNSKLINNNLEQSPPTIVSNYNITDDDFGIMLYNDLMYFKEQEISYNIKSNANIFILYLNVIGPIKKLKMNININTVDNKLNVDYSSISNIINTKYGSLYDILSFSNSNHKNITLDKMQKKVILFENINTDSMKINILNTESIIIFIKCNIKKCILNYEPYCSACEKPNCPVCKNTDCPVCQGCQVCPVCPVCQGCEKPNCPVCQVCQGCQVCPPSFNFIYNGIIIICFIICLALSFLLFRKEHLPSLISSELV
jgi:hypothetical protein